VQLGAGAGGGIGTAAGAVGTAAVPSVVVVGGTVVDGMVAVVDVVGSGVDGRTLRTACTEPGFSH
jgi:hypothetical protein